MEELLKHLVVDEEQADVVKYIYKLAANKSGFCEDRQDFKCRSSVWQKWPPNDFWRADDFQYSDESCRVYGLQQAGEAELTRL